MHIIYLPEFNHIIKIKSQFSRVNPYPLSAKLDRYRTLYARATRARGGGVNMGYMETYPCPHILPHLHRSTNHTLQFKITYTNRWPIPRSGIGLSIGENFTTSQVPRILDWGDWQAEGTPPTRTVPSSNCYHILPMRCTCVCQNPSPHTPTPPTPRAPPSHSRYYTKP
jgi:hypothetical protein